MSKPPYLLTEETLTIYFNDVPHTIHSTHANWEAIVTHLEHQEWGKIPDLINQEKPVQRYLSTDKSQSIRIEGDVVYYNDEPLYTGLTRKILQMMREDQPVEYLIKFLKNLMENPSKSSVEELYGFLKHGNMPITKDGHFLAYKRIRADWTDCYTGTMDNRIGKEVEMPRNQVNDNRHQTCSEGLHFASKEYLTHFHGERLIAIKINPRDVVSIPTDYNNSKGRCCKYKVVEELDINTVLKSEGHESHWDTSVVDYDDRETW